MASAAPPLAVVSRSSRPPSCSTRPSAVSRRNISLAACVVTPRWRAIPAAVARAPPSSPPLPRSASRYSWAAADRSRRSFLRGIASGYRACQAPNLADAAVAEPDEPGHDDQPTEQRPAEGHPLRVARREQQERRGERGAEDRDRADRRDPGEPREQDQDEQGGELYDPGQWIDHRRARGGEPAATAHLARQPASAE